MVRQTEQDRQEIADVNLWQQQELTQGLNWFRFIMCKGKDYIC